MVMEQSKHFMSISRQSVRRCYLSYAEVILLSFYASQFRGQEKMLFAVHLFSKLDGNFEAKQSKHMSYLQI